MVEYTLTGAGPRIAHKPTELIALVEAETPGISVAQARYDAARWVCVLRVCVLRVCAVGSVRSGLCVGLDQFGDPQQRPELRRRCQAR
jgi:hypothetical protein